MKSKCRYYLAAIAVASLATVGAQAQVTGSIWENYSSTDVGAPPTSVPNVTFTANQVDFGNDGNNYTTPYTIAGFLNGNAGGDLPSAGTPPTTYTILTVVGSALTDSMYTDSGNTYVQLTGSLYLNAGVNKFQAGHDDGLVISVAGIGNVLNEPAATALDVSGFSITAPSAGEYNYTLDYVESSGPPAALYWAYPNGQPVGTVPDSASTLGLMGLGLTGVGLLRRRLNK